MLSDVDSNALHETALGILVFVTSNDNDIAATLLGFPSKIKENFDTRCHFKTCRIFFICNT